MPPSITITHPGLEVQYPIYFKEGLLQDKQTLAQYIHQALAKATRVLIVTDEHVAPLYSHFISNACNKLGIDTQVITLPAGEPTKCWQSAEQIFNTAITQNLTRHDGFIALGGGVIGDLTGYCAATYHRGTPYLQIPTSLLAQVDSSVGGKVAIHVGGVKNSIGAFYHPQAVLIDTDTLSTLPKREWQAGMAEVVKYGLLEQSADPECGKNLFKRLEDAFNTNLNKPHEDITQTIAMCCQLKQAVVQADETETSGHRMILNLGHTYAHILESATQYTRFLHGEAVALGLVAACQESSYRGLLPHSDTQRVIQLLNRIGLPTNLPDDLDLDEETALCWLAKDKKNRQQFPNLILPTATLGKVHAVTIPNELEAMSLLRRWLKP